MYSKQIIIKILLIKLFKIQNSENKRNDTREYDYINLSMFANFRERECVIQHDIVDELIEHYPFRYLYFLYL